MTIPPRSRPLPKTIARGSVLPLDQRVLVMGILNVTPDSFSDGGRYLDPGAACARALEMEQEGADVVDIGAESSRPGAAPVGEEEELRRLMPVVTEVCRRVRIPVSVDTTKSRVAKQGLDAGAALINDITALRGDPDMSSLIAESGAGIVLMHMQGSSQTMQEHPWYDDVTNDIRVFFRERMDVACASGIQPEQIILDPGFGFGKNLNHNLAVLANLDAFQELERPLMVGISRKAFVGRVVGREGFEGRLLGAAGAVATAIILGARMVRVHDVAQMRDVIRMVEAIVGARSQHAKA